MMEPKRARIEIPVNRQSTSQEILMDSNINLTYDALRYIFQYLSVWDLSRTARVCRSWLEAANAEEKRRKELYCIVQNCYNPPTFNVKKSIISYCVRQSSCKPSIALFFMPEELEEDIEDYMRHLLPKNCKTIILYSVFDATYDGIASIFLNNQKINYPFSTLGMWNMGCLFLPEMQNEYIRINTYLMTMYEEKNLEALFMHKLDEPNHKTLTCLMLIGNCHGGRSMTLQNLLHVAKRKSEKIDSLFAGSVYGLDCMNIDKFKGNNPRNVNDCLIILMSGAVRMWSIGLNKNNLEKGEERLQLFKNQVKLKKYSVGFMFYTKRMGYFRNITMVGKKFHDLFPKVPLIGCFHLEEAMSLSPIDDINNRTFMPERENNTRQNNARTTFQSFRSFQSFRRQIVFMILTYDM